MIELHETHFSYLEGRCKFQMLYERVWNERKHKPFKATHHDVLGFLFREILQQLVEMTIIAKKERAHFNKYQNFTNLKQTPQTFTMQTVVHPNDVIEVYRRCVLNKGTNILNTKNLSGFINKSILL